MNNRDSSAIITMRETKRDFNYNKITVLSLSISRPEVMLVNNPQAQLRINSRYYAQANSFYRMTSTTLYRQAVQFYHESVKNDFPFRPFDAVMNYDITFNQACYLSSYSDRYQYTGGAHGSTLRASDTFSLKTGRRLPLSHFFQAGFNYRGFLIGQIIKQADRNMQSQPIYFENYRELIVQHFNPASYFLSPEGINIYYQQYEIAPYASGIIVFTVPYGGAVNKPSC
ncbi:MAG: DUF3298 and DUF4163 domain-containing protein [Oscillospiraceae bacterium]|nr:DUF3298 and DUF4163 domain-containing protein [Oscillospiraceae bacterium]MDD4413745.1 DUF3298 and DUF4163 domain-containing protein [Oscillospiraceae bacterium]